jgi:hypothetical protein
MAGFKAQIADALKTSIEAVTIANGYSHDVGIVSFDRIRLNIADYQDFELPAVQIIDLSTIPNHEMSRSRTQWFLALELCMRTTEELGIVDQQELWDFEESVSYVTSATLIDGATDLHMLEPNYISTIGLQVEYYEPITRSAC